MEKTELAKEKSFLFEDVINRLHQLTFDNQKLAEEAYLKTMKIANTGQVDDGSDCKVKQELDDSIISRFHGIADRISNTNRILEIVVEDLNRAIK